MENKLQPPRLKLPQKDTYMQKIQTFSATFLCLCLMITSCSKENSRFDQNKILTRERIEALEAAADSVFAEVSAPGMMALISVEGEGDYVIKRGVSNTVTNKPMDETQYFRIGSITKTFTGTAVLILVDEGKINLDHSIASYLPEYQIPNGDLITIRMLGNMTSGLFNYTDDIEFWMSMYNTNFLNTYTPDSLLAYAFRHPVSFPPGAGYSYCNTNTVLLGLLMEKVTGKSARDVIVEKVIKPMNLTHTYWQNSMFLPSPYMHGYSAMFGTLEDATNWNPTWAYTAGELISTIADLKIWVKACAEGELLSEATKQERFTYVQDHYGFCVMKAGNWIGHPGNIPGFNSHAFYNASLKTAMVIVVNMESGTPVEYFTPAFANILER